MSKSISINIPEDQEIDLKKSDFIKGVIVFKKKNLTYDDILNSMVKSKSLYYMTNYGHVGHLHPDHVESNQRNIGESKEQLESILALNKLINVAKYLNGSWVPNFKKIHCKFFISYYSLEELQIAYTVSKNTSAVYFKSKELAQQAIEILGEEEIKKALTLNHYDEDTKSNF